MKVGKEHSRQREELMYRSEREMSLVGLRNRKGTYGKVRNRRGLSDCRP